MSVLDQPQRNFNQGFVDWCKTFTDAPEQYLQAVSYSTVASLLGRKVYLELGDSRLYPCLWLLILGRSSFLRKSTALRIGENMIRAVNEPMLLPSEWTKESLVALLRDRPQGAMFAYEFKTLLGFLQATYNVGAMSLLTELYDCPPSFTRRKGVDDPEEFRIEQPFISITGASTIDWLVAGTKRDDIASGFLARFLFVSAEKKEKSIAFQPKADQTERNRLVDQLRQSVNVSGEMYYAPDAKRHYEAWFARFELETAGVSDAFQAFFPRLASYAHKFAMIESVVNGHHPQITIGDARRATMLAENFAEEVRKLSEGDLGKSGFDKCKAVVLRILRDKGGSLDYSPLLRTSGLPAKVMKDTLQTLSEGGQIKDAREETPRRIYLLDGGGVR